MEQLQTSPETMVATQEGFKSMEKPEEQLNIATQGLLKFGGFDLLESTIEGIQNVNPERKARKKIFLEETAKKQEREALKKTLEWWVDVLKNGEDISEMVQSCQEKSNNAEQLLKKNLKTAIEGTRNLERSYRSVALFYKNTESLKVKNVSIINVSPEQLKDLDNERFIIAVQNELV